MKKIISLVLVTVFMLMSLVSCAYSDDPFREGYGLSTEHNSTGTEGKYSTPTLANTEIVCENYGSMTSAVPKGLNFEGMELVVLAGEKTDTMREWVKVEGYDTEIDLQVQDRNDLIEVEMNLLVKVNTVQHPGNWDSWMVDINTTVLNDVSTGHYYDMYSHFGAETSALAIRGCQANLLDEEILPYFDFSMPCWNKSLVDQALNGKLLYVAGAMNLTLYDNMMVMWHNQRLYNNIKSSDDPESMLDVALEGDFTYDIFYQWANFYQDAGKGKFCLNTYGISDLESGFYEAIPYALGIEFVKTNADGTHSLSILDNQRADNVIADLRYLRDQKGVNNCQEKVDGTKCVDGIVSHFASGLTLFMPNTLKVEEWNSSIREMELDSYAVLPLPKYNETDKYKTTAVGDFSLVSALNHGTDVINGGAISAFYQKATETSYISTKAWYLESLIAPRYFGYKNYPTTSKSLEIIETLTDATVFDTVNLYGKGIGNLAWNLDEIVENKKGNLNKIFTSTDMLNSGYSGKVQLKVWEDALLDFDAYIYGND